MQNLGIFSQERSCSCLVPLKLPHKPCGYISVSRIKHLPIQKKRPTQEHMSPILCMAGSRSGFKEECRKPQRKLQKCFKNISYNYCNSYLSPASGGLYLQEDYRPSTASAPACYFSQIPNLLFTSAIRICQRHS